jgi:hypothetical protein
MLRNPDLAGISAELAGQKTPVAEPLLQTGSPSPGLLTPSASDRTLVWRGVPYRHFQGTASRHGDGKL